MTTITNAIYLAPTLEVAREALARVSAEDRGAATKRYRITSQAGADHGVWDGLSTADALAAMHREAGYTCAAVGPWPGYVVFADADDEELCGNIERWMFDAID